MTREANRVIHEHLKWLHDTHDSTLNAEMVVRDAKRAASPLHPLFEWDDAVAGHQWRLTQAHELIRSVHIEVRIRRDTVRAPAYVHSTGRVAGYRSVLRVRSKRAEARMTLMSELAMIRGALRRARAVATVLGLEEEVDLLLSEVTTIDDKIERVAA